MSNLALVPFIIVFIAIRSDGCSNERANSGSTMPPKLLKRMSSSSTTPPPQLQLSTNSRNADNDVQNGKDKKGTSYLSNNKRMPPEEWIVVAHNKECDGSEIYKGRFRVVKDCASACKGLSHMFIFGVGSKCTKFGCHCWCEESAFADGSCSMDWIDNYKLYKYLNSYPGTEPSSISREPDSMSKESTAMSTASLDNAQEITVESTSNELDYIQNIAESNSNEFDYIDNIAEIFYVEIKR